MLKHYLLLSFRHFLRHKIFTAITVGGLTIGITCTILLGLYLVNEFSFDRFHDKSARIYRLTQTQQEADEIVQLPYASPSTASLLEAEFPSIEEVVQLGITAPVKLASKDNYLIPKGSETFYASPAVFDVFTFPLITGEPSNALSEPFSIVLTNSLAHGLFGNVDPMGQVLDFQVFGREMPKLKVTGILAEIPATSHLTFDCLVSFATLEQINRNNRDWADQNVLTYLLLNEETVPGQLEKKFPNFLENYWGKEQAVKRQFQLQALRDIHLHSTHFDSDRANRGDYQNLCLLLAIALGIICIAVINFINLTTARARVRMKEIGVRKTMGANRGQLTKQFLSEAIMFTLLAMGLSLFLVEAILPEFNAFLGKGLGLNYGKNWTVLLSFALLLGFLSGLYPSLYLSKFRPVEVLKGAIGIGSNSAGFRNSMVVMQFAIATILVIATAIVWKQLQFIQHKDLGYQKEQVLQTVIPSNRSTENEMFLQELLQHPNILEVGRAVVRPLYDMNTNFPTTPTSVEMNGAMEARDISLRKIEVGYGFTEAFRMRLLAGRSFSATISTDAKGAFLLNESALRVIGWKNPLEALGKRLNYDNREGTIIGVMEDFHFEGLHHSILPFVMVYNKFSPMVFVKVDPNGMENAIAHLQQSWEKHATGNEPFQYTFMDDYFSAHYAEEKRLQTLLFGFGLLSVFITCLGVFGLTIFTVERRKKEMGIRKVLGASVVRLIALLSKETLVLFLLANVIAWPLVGYFGHQWLQNFAYQEKLRISSFFGPMLLVGIITFATVGMLSLKAAMANPVESLRNE